jgi:hypothetical protein
MRRFLFTLALGPATAAIVAGAAIAAPGNGAEVVKQHFCVTEPGLFTFCSDVELVMNTTQTPSGNTIVLTNGSIGETFIGEGGDFAGCTTSFDVEIRSVYLNKPEEPFEVTQASHRMERGESSNHCAGILQDCVIDYHEHYANGEYQFFRPDITCTQSE